MASFRHLARILIMQTLFAHEFRGGQAEDILQYNYSQNVGDKKIDLSFAQTILSGIQSNFEKIKQIIEENAPEWPFDRIARIDRAILQIGVYEIVFLEDVPNLVAINEAIEIAKTYGGKNSSKFVNGVLSAVMEKYPEKSKP